MSRLKMAAGPASVRKYRIKLELLIFIIFQILTTISSSTSHCMPSSITLTDNRRTIRPARYLKFFFYKSLALTMQSKDELFSRSLIQLFHIILARAKKITSITASPSQASPERQVRSRQAGVSQSQRKAAIRNALSEAQLKIIFFLASSRSTSPSSRLHHYTPGYSVYRQTGTVPKKTTTGIPRSLANSRETSPSRSGSQFNSLNRRQIYNTSSPRRAERPPLNPGRQYSAQKILQQSREAESALSYALSPDEQDFQNDIASLTLDTRRKISREESDDGSEASSVCSERSFDSNCRRGNDTYSWNGSRSRLDGSAKFIDDIETIIQYCGSSHWSERKDGLTNLTQYLSDGKLLTPDQLQGILDLFRKMFMDPHIKVYSLFLDTVNELILSHSPDLHDWLFILLTRLFNKLGTDLLGSMHQKIWKTLTLIYEYFPANLQLQSVFKILTDSTQTPNVKTKHASVKFLTTLIQTYCSPEEFTMTQPADRAILKILSYASDQKSMELKQQAKHCIIALYNCNPATVSLRSRLDCAIYNALFFQMTLILASLPKQYQDAAKNYVQQTVRNNVSGRIAIVNLCDFDIKVLVCDFRNQQPFISDFRLKSEASAEPSVWSVQQSAKSYY